MPSGSKNDEVILTTLRFVCIWWDGEPLAPKVPVSDRRSL